MIIAFISRIFIQKVWCTKNIFSLFLLPLSWLYIFLVQLRYLLYDLGVFSVVKINVPVIIVGNIVIGGTGKTPLVIWLAEHFREKGFSPGVISRGYGGTYTLDIELVKPTSDPLLVGDEPIVIARNTHCPVIVGKDRGKAAKELVERYKCDIILSDDGMQHYSLARDIEIIVIDAERPFGNGYCLPAGPCREPKLRPFFDADFIVNAYKEDIDIFRNDLVDRLQLAYTSAGIMDYQPSIIMHYIYKELAPVSESTKSILLSDLQGMTVHAVAGIHNPAYFFSYLRKHKLDLIIHQFSDHHIFTENDIKFDDNLPVVMTEKDAVKCFKFSDSRHWYVPVKAELTESFAYDLDKYMEKISNG